MGFEDFLQKNVRKWHCRILSKKLLLQLHTTLYDNYKNH